MTVRREELHRMRTKLIVDALALDGTRVALTSGDQELLLRGLALWPGLPLRDPSQLTAASLTTFQRGIVESLDPLVDRAGVLASPAALVTFESPAEGVLVFHVYHANFARLRQTTERLVKDLFVMRNFSGVDRARRIVVRDELNVYENDSREAVGVARVVHRAGWWRRQWDKVRQEKAAELFVMLLAVVFLVIYIVAGCRGGFVDKLLPGAVALLATSIATLVFRLTGGSRLVDWS